MDGGRSLPYSKFYLRDIKARFGKYWKNHFATVGIDGMNESLLNLLGVSMTDSERAGNPH